MKRLTLSLLTACLLGVAGCSGGATGTSGPPPVPRDRWGRVDSRAEYEAQQRRYANAKRQLERQRWEALQRRAARHLTEKEQRDAAQQARDRTRWQEAQ